MNISLDKMMAELNSSQSQTNGKAIHSFLENEGEKDLFMQLSPQQKNEIQRIRQESKSRCQNIISQVFFNHYDNRLIFSNLKQVREPFKIVIENLKALMKNL